MYSMLVNASKTQLLCLNLISSHSPKVAISRRPPLAKYISIKIEHIEHFNSRTAKAGLFVLLPITFLVRSGTKYKDTDFEDLKSSQFIFLASSLQNRIINIRGP